MGEQLETLVILSPGFPENEADTTCLPAHQVFVRALNRTFPRLKIIIIAFQYPFAASEYCWNGNTVISLNGSKHRKLKRLFFWVKAWKTLKLIEMQNRVKGLLSFWLNEYALIGKHFGRMYKIRHYCWVTGQDAKKGNFYARLMRPTADELFAMSDFLANQFYKNYNIKPQLVIPNGIDIELFSSQKRQRCIDVLAAGSLIPLKQYHIFIEVVKLLADEVPGIQAVLCGKGPEERRLVRMVDEVALDENIRLAGAKKHTEVLGLMQQCKVFLHTSNYEGFSTVCLEALYAGAHVVSFFKPMEKDIEHWHIVQTKEEMAQKTLELLLSPTTDYTPVLAYAMDDVAKQVMQLYL
jgi:glycosyltransferase involved in cell wall biosynthesis